MFKHLFLFSTLVIACVECYYVGMKTGEGELRSDGGGSIWAGSCLWLAIHQEMGKCHIRNKESKLVEVGKDLNELHFRSGVPNLQDLMPDDLRWSWCNNNGNKGLPSGLVVKNLPANAGVTGSVPGLGRNPHASERLCPTHPSYWASPLEPKSHNCWGLCS